MNDAEDAVKRVLGGLGRAEAAEGLEARVLASVQASARAGLGTQGPMLLARGGRGSWALAAGLVAVLSLVTAWGVYGRVDETARPVARPAARPSGAGPVTATPERAELVPGPAPKMASARAKMPARRGLRTAAMERRNAVEAWREDPGFLRRMHRAGFPAPPEPLTAQEQLLVQLARRPDAVTEASLNPEERAKRDADEANAVMAFFEPPRDPKADTQPKRKEAR